MEDESLVCDIQPALQEDKVLQRTRIVVKELLILVKLDLLLNEILSFLKSLRVNVSRTRTHKGFFNHKFATIGQRVALLLQGCYYGMIEEPLKVSFSFQILYDYLVWFII